MTFAGGCVGNHFIGNDDSRVIDKVASEMVASTNIVLPGYNIGDFWSAHGSHHYRKKSRYRDHIAVGPVSSHMHEVMGDKW